MMDSAQLRYKPWREVRNGCRQTIDRTGPARGPSHRPQDHQHGSPARSRRRHRVRVLAIPLRQLRGDCRALGPGVPARRRPGRIPVRRAAVGCPALRCGECGSHRGEKAVREARFLAVQQQPRGHLGLADEDHRRTRLDQPGEDPGAAVECRRAHLIWHRRGQCRGSRGLATRTRWSRRCRNSRATTSGSGRR